MISQKGFSATVQSVLIHTFLFVLLVIFILPYYWMIISSLKVKGGVFVIPPQWLPTSINLKNYISVFERTNFGRGFFNSTFVTLTKTVLTLLFSAMAGFAFAKYDFPGKKGLFAFLLGTMMIPAMVTMIPMFIVIVRMALFSCGSTCTTYPMR